jgi:hypothetical protein
VDYRNVNISFRNKNPEKYRNCLYLGARNHAAEIIDMAFDMLDSIVTVTNPTNNEKLKIRIGMFVKLNFEETKIDLFRLS